MKVVIGVLVALTMLGTSGVAQTTDNTPAVTSPLPADFAFLGVGFNQSLPQQRAVGSFAWGHRLLKDQKLYAFTRADMLGVSYRPLQIQTVMTTGVCQITNEIRKVFLGACIDAGMAVTGTNIGGSIGADGLAGMRIGKSNHWAVIVMGGVVKTALSNAVNPIRAGVAYGW